MNTKVRNGLLQNFREYIIAVFGNAKYSEWLKALKKEPQELFSSGKFPKTWYDAEAFYIQPAIMLCRLTESGRTNAVWNSGVWGVETWIKGWIKWVYSLFSPEQLLLNFLPMSATYYYKPVKIVKISVRHGEAVLYIEGMHGSESMLAYRFGGGVEKVLELKGCKNILVQISSSHEMFADTTVFFITWE